MAGNVGPSGADFDRLWQALVDGYSATPSPRDVPDIEQLPGGYSSQAEGADAELANVESAELAKSRLLRLIETGVSVGSVVLLFAILVAYGVISDRRGAAPETGDPTPGTSAPGGTTPPPILPPALPTE